MSIFLIEEHYCEFISMNHDFRNANSLIIKFSLRLFPFPVSNDAFFCNPEPHFAINVV